MKLLFLSFALAFSGFVLPEDVVYVEFTNKNTFDDLVDIREKLAEKGISLTYKEIKFDERNKLKALSIEVDCNDGTSGSGNLMDFLNGSKLTFTKDYRPEAKTSIEINVIRGH